MSLPVEGRTIFENHQCHFLFYRPRLKNIDRSSAQQKAVTVNNVTVIITEFQPKRRISSDTAANGPQSSSGNSTDSSQSDSASHSEAHNGESSDRRWLGIGPQDHFHILFISSFVITLVTENLNAHLSLFTELAAWFMY